MKYRAEIDGLRALAVIPVILYHAGFQLFKGGYVGVDIFFVISGYLITSIILSELEIGKFSLINFYERRARRILPALFVVMFTCLPFAWVWLYPDAMKEFSESLISVSAFVSNILFWRTSGYFETSTELKPLIHTWSLAVEEQYYLLFPPLLILTWKFGKRWICGLLAAIFIISLLCAQWLSIRLPSFAFYMLPTRGWEILIGAFIAFCYSDRNIKVHNHSLDQWGSFLGLLLISYSVLEYNEQTPFPSLYTLAPTLGAALIIVFATHRTITGKLLSSWPFVGIGLISYSAYLWHQPLFAFARQRSMANPKLSLMLFLTALSFGLGLLSWRYIERPFRDQYRFSRKKIFVYSIVCSTFFIIFGVTGHINRGYENRFNSKKLYDGDISHLDFHKYISDRYVICTPKNIASTALQWEGYIRCMQSKDSDNIDIAIIGDSHAEHLFIGLAENLPSKNVAFYIKGSPPFASNREFDDIFSHVLKTKSITTIFISMYWAGRLSQVPKGSSLELELIKTFKPLINSGKRVYLVDDVPNFSFPPERCKFYDGKFGSSICEAGIELTLIDERKYKSHIQGALNSFPEIKYIPLRDLFCNNDKCGMVRNGVLMYRDWNHLNILGSRFAGSEIVKINPELNN